jgi:CheY-like chemotaxis protein
MLSTIDLWQRRFPFSGESATRLRIHGDPTHVALMTADVVRGYADELELLRPARDKALLLAQPAVHFFLALPPNELFIPRESPQGECVGELASTRVPVALIVDEHADLRSMMNRVLPYYGVHALSAANGLDALTLFQQHRATISLVLLNVVMAGMDGPETLSALRSIGCAAPVIFMTSGTGRFTLSDLARLGPAAVLIKPFDMSHLAQLVSDLTGQK